ncbi:MAG: type 2 lantipeptide synthetase LanM family protein [Deltaproteobacteria bacterium]|nr:type 2 lantipeptide synthetase LanM family protein [Deltaproteobacteria bacterium]MBP7287625.1 type 2 lantipeptide synthetase LanM family protein [Nannocystaceae bacterium]
MTVQLHHADAASLGERIAGLVEPVGPAAGCGGDELQQLWQTRVTAGSQARWARRLTALGPTPHTIPALLGAMQAADGVELPWERSVEALLDDVARLGASFEEKREPSPLVIPFHDLLAPLADVGVARARAATAADAQVPVPLHPGAWAQLRRQLHWRLAAVSEPTLSLEFSIYRAQHRSSIEHLVQLIAAPDSAVLYRAFVGETPHARLAMVASRYPVLARCWASLVDDWVDATAEMLIRLHRDRCDLAAFLGVRSAATQVTWVRPDLSDSHRGGRTVAHIAFADGTQIIYKPRNIDIESRWTELLRWCAARGAPVPLSGLRVLSRAEYGWVEVAAARPCASRDDFGGFYRRAGAMLCLVYLLAGTDCHRDNIVADGAMPVLVDAETLMHPGSAPVAPQEEDAHAQLTRRLTHSVLSTALLPHWSPTPDGGGFEGSGIGPGGTLPTSLERLSPIARNTDAASLQAKQVELVAAKNVPHCDGALAVADDYVAEIIEGFESTAAFVMSQREAMLADDGPIEAFANSAVRVLLRATADYDLIRDRARSPAAMRSGAARSIFIDTLMQPLLGPATDDSHHALWEAARREQAELERNDIPRFEVRANSSASRWRAEWDHPGLQIARARIASLDVLEIRRQVGLIDASFEARGQPRGSERAQVEAAPSPSRTSDRDLVREVERITERIKSMATRGRDDTATWLTIDVIEGSLAYTVHPMGPTLYNGVAGVALFLAAASVALQDRDARCLALGAVRSLRQQVNASPRFAPGTCIGGIMGTPSAAYALAWMGHILGDASLIDDAVSIVRRCDAAVIRSDTHYDLSSGAAGLILVLLTVHAMRPWPGALEQARLCGEHLLAARVGTPASWPTPTGRRLAGLAHGASGTALALQRLSEATGDRRYRDAAFEALDHERTLYHPEVENWQDVRPDVPGPGPSFMSSWCNGAPGIGMARVHQRGAPRRDAELTAALRTTERVAFGHLDHFCCGNVGRSELLLDAGHRLHEPALVAASRRAVDRMVARARATGAWTLSSNPRPGNEQAGLFRGLAGIGWHLLRHLQPQELPALGVLEGPDSRESRSARGRHVQEQPLIPDR